MNNKVNALIGDGWRVTGGECRLYSFICAAALLSLAIAAQAADYVTIVSNTPNLLAYWRFDPVFQTNSLVNGYTGSLQGNAIIGPPGSGVPLPNDPTNQSLEMTLGPISYLLTDLYGGITNEGSVMAWIYLTEEPSVAGNIFHIAGQSQDGNDFDLQIQPDNGIYFYTDSGGHAVYPAGIPVGQWHFVAGTFVANSTRVLYLDGVPVASSTPGPHSLNTSNPFSVGYNIVFGGRQFDGNICEVAVFSRCLSATEIANIYQASLGPTLAITQQGNSVALSWPTNYSGFGLQTNGALTNLTAWTADATVSNIIGTNYTVTESPGSNPLFYRLAK